MPVQIQLFRVKTGSDRQSNVPMMNSNDDIRSISQSCSSSANDESQVNSGNTKGDTTGKKLEKDSILANNETQKVKRLRVIVGLVLIISTVCIAVAIYLLIRNSEHDNFTVAYESDTNRILQGMGLSIQNSLGAMQSFGSMMASFAKHTNQTFPFFTLPDFAIQSSRLLTLTSAIQISLQVVVTSEQRAEWDSYSMKNQWWVNETKHVQEIDQFFYGNVTYGAPNPPRIWDLNGDRPNEQIYLPQWQNYPTMDPCFNWDFLSATIDITPYTACINNNVATFSPPYNVPDPNDPVAVAEKEFWSAFFQNFLSPDEDASEPCSDLMYPVSESMATKATFQENRSQYPVAGALDAITYWRDFIRNLLPDSSRGIIIYFENSCAGSFSYQIFGPKVTYLGRGDHHDDKYNDLVITKKLHETIEMYRYSGALLDSENCPFTVYLYPSAEYESSYTTDNDIIYPICVVLIFVFVSLVFFIYDLNVERRQNIVMNTAEKTSSVVDSLFPSVIRDQLLQQHANNSAPTRSTNDTSYSNNAGEFSQSATISQLAFGTKAMASLYPETTVFFADLSGFTAWSSSRTPSQVFALLEVLYGAFDSLASRRKVFKVETIGDCYVAATGLPEPMKNHAVVMARFAVDCLNKTSELTGQLVATFGLETADLRLRIGVNSGPTTAGVLRGDKARFQLFGDTVNTAARMESTGIPGCIQLSQKTADLLITAGKESWLSKRNELVEAKGKGSMVTYWLSISGSTKTATSVASRESNDAMNLTMFDKDTDGSINQLVEWNFGIFKDLLLQVVRSRGTTNVKLVEPTVADGIVSQFRCPLDEISETIETGISETDPSAAVNNYELNECVQAELRDLIMAISHLYKPNQFHNFEHASHVVMSTMKLLDTLCPNEPEDKEVHRLHLDSLTQLAIVFSALIHDIDHSGLSNRQLIEEDLPIAKVYCNKSIAEQNSIDVAWELFMQPSFDALRLCMFNNSVDMTRFRQVVVNSVLATDIFDQELKLFRESRWDQVFSIPSPTLLESSFARELYGKRKTAIVIEHLIQASDVVHTMQHWKVYQKWNKKLFLEMYYAYQKGYSKQNPANGWYAGELWFFDNYIIPLAKKLRICGVFGVSCDELLDYAMDNRSEWEKKGEQIVLEWEEMIKKM